MDKSNFDRLLKRYVTDQVTEAEKIKIEAVLDINKTGSYPDERLAEDVKEKIYQRIIDKHSSVDEVIQLVPRGKIKTFGWVWRVAASLLVVALLSYTAWQFGRQNQSTVMLAGTGPVEKIVLLDGSIVWLKGTGKLIFYLKEDEGIRYAELKGEALFEVAKDPTHPFVINCGHGTLRVLGTSFSVRTDADSLSVKVLTGKVNIELNDKISSVNVLPHEQIVFARSGKMEKLPLQTEDAMAVTAGTEYDMKFSNTPFAEVVQRLEKKFNVHITVDDRQAEKCTLTIDLTDTSLDRSLQLMTEVLDVTYVRKGDAVVVSGKGC